jgi:hypothetical protein
MKRTLIISRQYPSPENIGSSMRTLTFTIYFKEYGQVDLAYSHLTKGGFIGNPLFSEEYFLEIKKVTNYRDLSIKWLGIWNRPLEVSKFQDSSHKKLLEILENNKYEYILIRYIYSTQCH